MSSDKRFDLQRFPSFTLSPTCPVL